jgi:multidrug resistance efflux pump
MQLTGIVNARVVEARFALSGKTLIVKKFSGDIVQKGELIASLDRKVLQAQLERQLADYEKIRADFEIFSGKIGGSVTEVDKYLKTEKQAMLNASVKEVEISKFLLDSCDLFSPVNGIIMDDSSVVAGLNVTPSGSIYKIIDSSSYYLKILLNQNDLGGFQGPREVKINLQGFNEEITSRSTLPYWDGKNIFVNADIPANSLVLIGLTGTVTF